MKFKLIGLLLISSLFGCREAIKNDVKFVAEQDFQDIQFTEPKVSNSLVVNTKEDLLGYWVGDFDANLSDEEMDTIYGNESYSNLITRKITFSIDEIKGDSIIGHSISAGNISPFKGLLSENTSGFTMEVDEFKKTKTDGKFIIEIRKTDSILKGNWNEKRYSSIQLSSRCFQGFFL